MPVHAAQSREEIDNERLHRISLFFWHFLQQRPEQLGRTRAIISTSVSFALDTGEFGVVIPYDVIHLREKRAERLNEEEVSRVCFALEHGQGEHQPISKPLRGSGRGESNRGAAIKARDEFPDLVLGQLNLGRSERSIDLLKAERTKVFLG